jgi:hypothetical protein
MLSLGALYRLMLALIACLIGACALAVGARAQTASWQFTPVAAPASTTGSTSPNPVPLGQVGQISFWAPNRGLLITGGTEGVNNAPSGGVVPAGVWAYNGEDWHELSSVCGGAYGRIAWAGPDEFWTISDQRPGQAVAGTQPALYSLSLCHFLNGQVVGSYAMPLEQPDSYEPMDAAACENPDDCWFGGQDDASGHAFELHWDGTNVTEQDEPEDHNVNDMVNYEGQIDESVQIQSGDGWLPSENQNQPAVLHEIEGNQVLDQYTFGDGRVLPYYGSDVSPEALQGFALSTDGANQLWAAADPSINVSPSASLTILHRTVSGWSQITPAVPGSPTPSCTTGPALSDTGSSTTTGSPIGAVVNDNLGGPSLGTGDGAIAAMPGSGEAWLSLPDSVPATVANPSGDEASVALIDGNGCVQAVDNPDDPASNNDAQLDTAYSSVYTQAFTQASGQSSAPGDSGPINCPADNDCWMADSDGWLYHYTDGTQYPVDTDPNFAGVITVRPADAATVTVYGDVPPADDSGTGQTYQAPTGAPHTVTTHTRGVTVKLTQVKAKVLHRTELVLTFHLNTRARIQIIAERHGTVVGRSQRRVLDAGRRTLTLKLNPKRWPNHLKVSASPVKKTTKTTSK